MADNAPQEAADRAVVPFERVDTSHLSGAQRAAVLIMYLEEKVVRQLFDQLSEDEIRRVGEAIANMEHVDADLVQTIVAEFAGDLGQSLYLQSQGESYLKSVFPAVLGRERAKKVFRKMEGLSREDFQKRFGRMQPGAVAARLTREHPQTVAVACSVLESEMAAAVIGRLPHELQVEVALRMSRLKRFPVELLEDIEALLGEAVEEMPTMTTDGSQMVADLVNKLSNEDREELLSALSQRDESVAAEISRQMFKFELLRTVDARGIQNLLKEVERRDLATALKGADEDTRAKFYENMSARASEYLRDDMEAMGPTRLSEVEAAQQQIIAIALRLEEEGKLVFLGGGEAVVE